MYKRSMRKPDGRRLWLYSREPIPSGIVLTGGPAAGGERRAHMRWHPLRGEWITYASHRQRRTFLPGPDDDPLAPSSDPEKPTEVPAGLYDVAVFENLFPTFSADATEPPVAIVPTRPAAGAAEVVVFTQDPHGSLGRLPLDHIDLLFEVWADRYAELGARPDVQYVMPFENRGVEVGVTLHHPHGQIYAYPIVPPIPAAELSNQLAYFREKQHGLLESLIEAEVAEGARILFLSEHAVAFVPAFARYSYEVWIATRKPRAALPDLDAFERQDMARALKTILLKYDKLWDRPFPYVMVFHQAPTDGQPHPEAHLHIEFYPAFRMPGRLKYLAGSELGAGVFTADTLPEDVARELRAVDVSGDMA
jgi:UDPglucose--hexose-1-phosphate uridylyltransferase